MKTEHNIPNLPDAAKAVLHRKFIAVKRERS